MPTLINAEQRRQQVVEAAFRLIIAEGIEAMSLRKVAEESGLNIGSVRHYFDGHHDLLTAAAEEAGDRMGRRLADHPADGLRGLRDGAALDALQALVETVMPVDEPRRAEAIIVIELVMASRTKPVFRDIAQRMGSDLSEVMREALEALEVPHPDLAAAQLVAVIGGLTMDTVTPHGSLSVEQLREVLRAHLQLLLSTSKWGR